MATSTGPNLAPARRAVERLMDDTCRILRNPDGLADAVLNQTTFELEDPAGVAPVYRGRCLLTAGGGLQSGGRAREEAGTDYQESLVYLTTPIDSAPLEIGDTVQITSSRRDPDLKGKTFRILSVTYSSMAVSRKALLEGRT